jgi:hypothetical protein
MLSTLQQTLNLAAEGRAQEREGYWQEEGRTSARRADMGEIPRGEPYENTSQNKNRGGSRLGTG